MGKRIDLENLVNHPFAAAVGYIQVFTCDDCGDWSHVVMCIFIVREIVFIVFTLAMFAVDVSLKSLNNSNFVTIA